MFAALLEKYRPDHVLPSGCKRKYIRSMLLRQQFIVNDNDGSKAKSGIFVIIYRLFTVYLRIFRKKRIAEKELLVICSATAPEMRSYHAGKYMHIRGEKIYVAENRTIRTSGKKSHYFSSTRLFFRIIGQVSAHYIRRDKREISWITSSFHDILQLLWFSDHDFKVCVYLSLNIDAYFTAVFASEILRRNTILIASNSPMYRPIRYSWLPSGKLALCSAFQEQEAAFFIRNGWMSFAGTEMWGLEEEMMIDPQAQPITEEKEFDIMIYSSAEWARNELYWRERDVERIRRGDPQRLFIYRIFDEMVLDTVIAIKNRFPQIRVALCPHPYERMMMKKYDLQPAYLGKIISAGISFLSGGVNSSAYIRRSRCAVAECSTIIFDCWHFGVPAFTFSGKGYEGKFNVDYSTTYLGEWNKFCFDSSADLGNKITSTLQLV